LFADKVGLYKLAVTYRNIPRLLERSRSAAHHGGALLNVIGKPIHKLDGEYWTDRNTSGELTFTLHTHKIADDFEEACQQKFSPPNGWSPAGANRADQA
jgi:hypothetical protein